jgi:hypothetical protein
LRLSIVQLKAPRSGGGWVTKDRRLIGAPGSIVSG